LDVSLIAARIYFPDSGSLPWFLIFESALALTVLLMIDCLLTALVADTQTSTRHNARKELVAQGIGNMLIGGVGGVGGGGTKGSTLACTMAGGRRWSPVFAASFILLIALFGRDLGRFLPLSALSGVIIYIGLNMINLNIIGWLKGRYTRLDAFNAIAVVIATLLFGMTKAVALGVVFAVIAFIRNEVKRSLVRRQSNIFEHPSPRKRSARQTAILSEHGDEALLIELQGNLYFAITDQLYRRVMSDIKGRKVIILHFRRVFSIDMSGIVILRQLVEAAKMEGTEIVFAHLHRRLGYGRKMKKAFSMIESKQKRIAKIFHSTERATEYAENVVLASVCQDEDYDVCKAVEFGENDLCKKLKAHEIALLKEAATEEVYVDRQTVLNEGEKSCALYLVISGFVEQRLYNGPTSYKILAKYSPGTYFGKIAFFNKGKIETRFVAKGDTTLYRIRKNDIERKSAQAGGKVYAHLLFVMGRNLSKETSRYISEIRRLEAL
jgi:SulP family sulfate permease